MNCLVCRGVSCLGISKERSNRKTHNRTISTLANCLVTALKSAFFNVNVAQARAKRKTIMPFSKP